MPDIERIWRDGHPQQKKFRIDGAVGLADMNLSAPPFNIEVGDLVDVLAFRNPNGTPTILIRRAQNQPLKQAERTDHDD